MSIIQLTEELAEKVDALFESKKAHRVIIFLVSLNALVFGLDAIPFFKERYENLLAVVDQILLSIFIIELLARIFVTRMRFFRNNWNTFDLMVTIISLLPASYGLSAIRILRVLHSMRLLELLPKTKHILDGFAHSLVGITNVVFLALVFYYVFGVIATNLFAEADPQNFGDLGLSMLNLFHVMTTGEWVFFPGLHAALPHAWAFFMIFVVVIAYLIVNLVVGVIVGAMAKAEEENELLQEPTVYEKAILTLAKDMENLKQDVANLRQSLDQQGK